jgi:FixJ family two-component response regulator
MPDTSGVELQSALRKQGNGVPFIFVTAFPEESARLQALRDGAVCFLSKPFDAPSFIRCVKAALNSGDATKP